jgi:hypothetical protein
MLFLTSMRYTLSTFTCASIFSFKLKSIYLNYLHACIIFIIGSGSLVFNNYVLAQNVFACTDSEGVVEYTTSKRSNNCRVLKLERSNIIPAYRSSNSNNQNYNKSKPPQSIIQNKGMPTPPPSPFLSNNSATSNFPSINTSVQQQRDNDRKNILSNEANAEAKKLQELQKEYNNGAPERRGDEKNYQKYLDRVDQLKKDMQRTQGNLDTLRKELSIN